MFARSRWSAVVGLAVIVVLAGCAAPLPEASPEPPIATPSAEPESYLPSLADLAETEWTGTDEEYRDRITFLFHADGTVSHRSAEGTFLGPGDVWSVDGETVSFTVNYEGAFGVGTHLGVYDPATGILDVEYTTTTNRASRIELRQIRD